MIGYNPGMRRRNGTTANRSEPWVGTIVVICSFLYALLLSRIRIHGLHTPLSMGLLLGCQLAGFEPAAIVGGIILGAFAEAKPYWQGVSAALLYWGISRIVLLIRKRCGTVVRLLIFVLCMLATLPISAIYGKEELLYGMISLSVSVLSAMAFRRIFLTVKTIDRVRLLTDAEQIAAMLGIGTVILAVSDAVFLEWSLSVSLLVLLTMLAVSTRGMAGAAAGTLWAVLLTLYTGSDPVLIGCIALGAVGAAALRDQGKVLIVTSFMLSGLLFRSFTVREAVAMSVPNLLCGILFFLLTPKRLLSSVRFCIDPRLHTERRASESVRRTERRASQELERMGKLLGGISGMFHPAPEEDDSVAKWTVQGALAICRNCVLRRQCWKEPDLMADAAVQLAKTAGKGDRAVPIEPIDENCRRFADLCASILLSYQQAQNRNAVGRQARMQSGFAERQLSGAGAALCTYAREMRERSRDKEQRIQNMEDRLAEAGYDAETPDIYETDGSEMISVRIRRPLHTRHSAVQRTIEQACGYPLRCIRAAQNKDFVSFRFERDAELHATAQVTKTAAEDTVSGDATGECRIPGGKVCFALSDGMGSGSRARSESEAAIRLLFRLYNAGVERDLVYENVNRMLLAQNESEMYATLDALSIDLHTGDAELLKYGAPPSFLLRDGQISTISGEALPCGILAEAKPSVIRLKLQRNDRIVLCSDGIQDVLPEGVEEAIRSMDNSGQKTGEALLKIAEARGGSDDMTVMVILVA